MSDTLYSRLKGRKVKEPVVATITALKHTGPTCESVETERKGT